MISLMLKILERESDNEGRIFLYLEEGKWVGYDRSALYLCRLVKDLPIVSHVVEGIFWLLKTELDVKLLPQEYVLCRSSKECILDVSQIWT